MHCEASKDVGKSRDLVEFTRADQSIRHKRAVDRKRTYREKVLNWSVFGPGSVVRNGKDTTTTKR